GMLKTEMKPLQGVVFGVFVREDIKVGEQVIVPKDSLVSIGETGEDGVAKLQGKFPQAKFYVKELETDDIHQLLEKEFDFVYEAKDNLEAQDIHLYEDGVAYGKQNLLKIQRKAIENYLV
ncbi:hypothetical protein COK29_29785, partial [Bacillus cereus]|uniref:prealbumin-like fold domain-containing protein n=1 Tax=Bacillus cereus TaxID=1396 RepID=UPI000C00DDAC